MSAREAYIAGRSGGSRPKQSGPSSTQRDKNVDAAYDAGRQERERAQTIRDEGISGLSQEQQEQAKTVDEQTGKDPYNTNTKEEKEMLTSYKKEQKTNKIGGKVHF